MRNVGRTLLNSMIASLAFSIPSMFRTASQPGMNIQRAPVGRSRMPGPKRPAGSKLARKALKGQVTLRHS